MLGDGFRDFPVKSMVLTSIALMLAAPLLFKAGIVLLIAAAFLAPLFAMLISNDY